MSTWLRASPLLLVPDTSPRDMEGRFGLTFVDGAGLAQAPSGWIHNPDLSAVQGVAPRWWVVDGDTVREATSAEKDAQIDAYRADRLSALRHAVNAYGESRGYDTATEMRLKDLHTRAVTDGLTNRAALIASALSWQASLLGYYMTKVAALESAVTVAGCDAVTWDFSQFDASDPGVTVTDVLKVSD